MVRFYLGHKQSRGFIQQICQQLRQAFTDTSIADVSGFI